MGGSKIVFVLGVSIRSVLITVAESILEFQRTVRQVNMSFHAFVLKPARLFQCGLSS
jgi:hypothetical protein